MKATIRSGLFLAISLLAIGAQAQQAKQYSVSDFFKNSEFAALRLSPNGEWLAALGPYEGRRNLFTMRLSDKAAARLTSFESKGRDESNQDVAFFFWANDERLIFGLDSAGNESFSWFAVNRDGTKGRTLVQGSTGIVLFPTNTSLLSRLDHDPEHVLVINNERNKFYPDVYRLNVYTGRMSRVETNPGYFLGYGVDWDGNVRIAVGHPDASGRALQEGELLKQNVYYRATTDSDWKIVRSTHEFDGPRFFPLAFAADNRTLYISTNEGRDTQAIYTFDPETSELGELILADDRADLFGLSLSPKDHRPLWVSWQYELPEKAMLDEDFAALQATIDAALPGKVNRIISMSDDENVAIIYSGSDRDPGTYYLYDKPAGTIEYFIRPRPWIEPDDMSEMTPVRYEARDGETIHAYLTVPAGSEARDLPLIINPHGGPYGIRDFWGHNSETQFLANRGYAVMQINYRGSGGYGQRFMDIAWQKWGLEMQDDITDGVLWAIEQGIADPGRVCIYGASYGGYATMAGITKTPELYQCAVNYVGVVDLVALLDYHHDFREGEYIQAWGKRAIGDRRADRERLLATSPINHLDKIKVPLYVVHGKRDPRVPHETQYAPLVRKLRGTEIDYKTMLKNREGHGFLKEENRIELYTELEKFFAEHIGGRSSQVAAAGVR
ncbi:MAG: S9 family peptidase [Gammaproteobacteria bacterium]|nr:S9 family peptidase [Gammaproteobacteria bacterium]MYD02753.1 S9 family peptidase [Gammaproteobacteria bacterium]MYI25834.1 S9 family peptidase [Gammaproteobacteria bacterium]